MRIEYDAQDDILHLHNEGCQKFRIVIPVAIMLPLISVFCL